MAAQAAVHRQKFVRKNSNMASCPSPSQMALRDYSDRAKAVNRVGRAEIRRADRDWRAVFSLGGFDAELLGKHGDPRALLVD
jgi:hypothetical protein